MNHHNSNVQTQFVFLRKLFAFCTASLMGLIFINSCSSSTSRSKIHEAKKELKPLTLKTGEFEECGKRGDKTGTDPVLCGYDYVEMASPFCPVIGYKGHDPSCGWKRSPASSGWVRWERCEGEWRHVNSRKVSEVYDCGDKACTRTITEIECMFYGEANFCQHSNPANGTPVYKPCVDNRHPIAGVRTCENAAFGVLHKSCSLYLTRSELPNWLEDRSVLVELTINNMLTHQANFYGAISDEKNFACMIKKSDRDPLYSDLVAELKTRYFTIFATEYQADKFDCQNESSVDPITSEKCSDDDKSLKCRTARAYKLSLNILQITAEDLKNLATDIPVVAPSGEEYRHKIQEMNDLLLSTERKP